ncbi:MAG: NAD(P)-dependent oxidoreductase [Xanthobacteraceae bacterium]|nr:NAD(P)-dependent oxidoreductase [Xanthobacteraceae bacterium]PWB65275.1 MAG: oxidoreductase [Bradyrhizobiaceae bacterium]
MDIGFIGLGNMGFPMARRLIEAGHKLTVFDTQGQMVSRLTALGAVAATSPRDVADRVETVMASLPAPDVVHAVATGADGVIAGKKVKRFVDLSTTGSRMAVRIADALQQKGIVQVDCPVSGGVGGAEKGTLAVMVSCPKPDYEALKDALAVIGRLFFIGEKPGLAQTMKLCNNLLSATALAATSEAMVMGVKAGLDPSVMIDVINAGSGRNSASQDKFPRSILPGTFDFGFANGLMYKDLRLCLEEAEGMGVPMWVGSAVRLMFQLATVELGPEKDFTTVVQCVERWAGVEVRARKGER